MIRIGARNSPLSRAHVDAVAAGLADLGVPTQFVPISTQGDVDRRQLTQIGGTGVFVGAVRDALLDGRIDVGVHSTKDLPTQPVDGLEVVAHPDRADTRDVLVGLTLDAAEQRSGGESIRIGTGAPRRAVQLEHLFAERGLAVRIEPVRGNVDTRLAHVRDGKLDAVVLAAAGLRRLNRIEEHPGEDPAISVAGWPAQLLAEDLLLPAPGQGALAVETRRALDSDIRRVLTRLDHAVTRAEVLAERRFLAVLEAGCTAPVGARATVQRGVRDSNSDLTLAAVIGRTREDGIQFHGAGQAERVTDDGDRMINRGTLITVTGTGLSTAATDLGDRLGRLVLSEVDVNEIRHR